MLARAAKHSPQVPPDSVPPADPQTSPPPAALGRAHLVGIATSLTNKAAYVKSKTLDKAWRTRLKATYGPRMPPAFVSAVREAYQSDAPDGLVIVTGRTPSLTLWKTKPIAFDLPPTDVADLTTIPAIYQANRWVRDRGWGRTVAWWFAFAALALFLVILVTALVTGRAEGASFFWLLFTSGTSAVGAFAAARHYQHAERDRVVTFPGGASCWDEHQASWVPRFARDTFVFAESFSGSDYVTTYAFRFYDVSTFSLAYEMTLPSKNAIAFLSVWTAPATPASVASQNFEPAHNSARAAAG